MNPVQFEAQPQDGRSGHSAQNSRDERAAAQGNGEGCARICEDARVAVRHVRRDGLDVLKKMEKDHGVAKDDHTARRNKCKR